VSALLCVAGTVGAVGTLVETGLGTSNASLSVTTWALLAAGIAAGIVVSSLSGRNRRRIAEKLQSRPDAPQAVQPAGDRALNE